MGWSGSTIEEHMPRNQEVEGLNPAGGWTLIPSFPVECPLSGEVSLTVFCEGNKKWMPSCVTWGKTGSKTLLIFYELVLRYLTALYHKILLV